MKRLVNDCSSAHAVMSDQSSSPSLDASTPPSSIPSPELGNLHLNNEVTEEDKQEATRLKAAANKAFTCQ